MMVTRQQLEQIHLQDDPKIETGGIAYDNETADEFVDSVFNDVDEKTSWTKENKINLNKLNEALHECGILPIAVNE